MWTAARTISGSAGIFISAAKVMIGASSQEDEMKMLRRAAILGGVLALLVPVHAGANGGADEELIATYVPTYAGVEHEATADQGELLIGGATASAEATPGGTIELSGDVDGIAVGGTGMTPPSVEALGRVLGPSFAWAGNQLRIEARFTYRLLLAQHDDVRIDITESNTESVRASVSAGFAGETAWTYQEPWVAIEASSSQVEVMSDGTQGVAGEGIVSTYVKVPCEGTTLSPSVTGRLRIDHPRIPLGVQSSARSAELIVYVAEMKVYRDNVLPCYHVEDIAVLDNSFSPQHVTVQQYQHVRFDFSGAQNYHDVIVPWHGSVYPGDPIDAYFPGVWTYYCTVHGTPDGQGMAGTITVT